jgi:hypothetical protein
VELRNTTQSVERHLHKIKVGVWCPVACKRMIGSNIFNKNINSQRYVKLFIRENHKFGK